MVRKYIAIPLLLVSVSMSGAAFSEEAHWGYSGDNGPEHWGDLDAKNVVCSAGKNQTPVDITGAIAAKLPPLVVDYKAHGGKEVLNNGHTIQVVYEPGSTIMVDGKEFELQQFHFHAPSENLVDGKSYAMEAHFVNKAKDGSLAVIGLLYKEGAANPVLGQIFEHLPKDATGEKMPLPKPISARDLLPKSLDYYRFSGSLTTPPCSEGVRWLVLKHTETVSKKQVEEFEEVMHHPNNRPIQPLNGRVILK